ncbi:MFS transporter [Actinomadura sp. KC216]|uniref:MFS transporter n=1 Tax=Actinomadura sp. KC216 TaxID=2530370 RepID=UPI001048E49A|nr:MFS transporter [Actinomadura sp. KC216]TDB91101.1 MFS transporter [Actinomadura sp. KC216]
MTTPDPLTSPATAAGPASNVIDDAPLTAFHRKLTMFCSGGPFLDGFALGVIGFALPQIADQWQLSGTWQGILAVAPLLGVPAVIGVGYLTDLLGRRIMYVADIAAITLLCVAQFFVTGPVQLLVLRVLLGIAIGADYPIASSLLAEFAPRKARAKLIGLQTIMWTAGNAAAYLVGAALLQLGTEAWRWILLSPAVIGALLAILRIGTPESPRWLISKGRTDEALSVVQKVYGPHATLDGIGEESTPTSLKLIFRSPYFKRTIFVGTFWACSITPVYAIYAFAPKLLEAFDLSGQGAVDVGSVLVGVFFLVGTIFATVVSDRLPRRTLLIWPFMIASAALLALGAFADATAIVVVVLFAVYAMAIGGPTILQWIYPNEIFPTEIRATAFSIGLSISRVGTILGTFAVPLLLDHTGISGTMIIVGVISAVGAVCSLVMAPETHGRPLTESAAPRPRDNPAA